MVRWRRVAVGAADNWGGLYARISAWKLLCSRVAWDVGSAWEWVMLRKRALPCVYREGSPR